MSLPITANNDVTILLVDDDDIDVIGVQRALKKLSLTNTLVRARDGIEGLQRLRDGSVPRPYIVLLDINMPRMNGLEMLAQIRNDPELSESIVFILTTSKADEDKNRAYQQHIAGYIVKSQVGDDFLQVMEMLHNYCLVVDLPTGS